MKKLLKKLLIFVCPIIVLAYPADWFISKGLAHSVYSDGEIETWTDIYTGQVNSDYVIYGSSRAWVHIDPMMIEKETGHPAYNFGMDAHNFYLQSLRHREYLRHNPKPEAIIYALDVFTLEKRPDLYNLGQFLPYMLWNKDVAETTLTYEGFTCPDFIIPLYRYIGHFDAIRSGLNYYVNPDARFREKGYKGKDAEWDGALERAQGNMKSYKAYIDTTSVRLFEDFIIDSKKEDIPLIFVYTPEYIEGQKFISNKDSVIAMYQKFSDKYAIPFFDYSNDSICYHKDYFYNSMHMNNRGSKLFTHKMIQDLMRDGLILDKK